MSLRCDPWRRRAYWLRVEPDPASILDVDYAVERQPFFGESIMEHADALEERANSVRRVRSALRRRFPADSPERLQSRLSKLLADVDRYGARVAVARLGKAA
jgi:hypothetical protein